MARLSVVALDITQSTWDIDPYKESMCMIYVEEGNIFPTRDM